MAITQTIPHSFSAINKEDGFTELTKRLPADELARLHEGLSRVTDPQVDSLVTAMKSMNWKASVLQEENCPHIALKAYQIMKISKLQFATVMFYWTNFTEEQKEARVIPLFTETGGVNPDARELIRQTLVIKETHLIGRDYRLKSMAPGTSFMTEQQLDTLIEEMRKCPASAHCIFLKEKGKLSEIVRRIHRNGFNVFYETDQGIMVPTCELVQTYLRVKYGIDSFNINVVLGWSTLNQIYESLKKRERDLVLRFPGTTIPLLADGAEARGFSITWHDIFHLALNSGASAPFVEFCLKLADFSKEYFEAHPECKLAEKFHEAVVDMELVYQQREYYDQLLGENNRAVYSIWGGALATNLYKAKILMKADSLATTLTERRFLEALVQAIPQNEAYRCGRTKEADDIDEEIEMALARLKMQLFYFPFFFFGGLAQLEDLKQTNIHRVVSNAWKRRLMDRETSGNTRRMVGG